MSEALALTGTFVTGILLGGIYFGGLWWTVAKALSSNRPALWFIGSLLLRVSLVLVGFYLVITTFIAAGALARLVSSLLGFTIARVVVTRLTRLPEEASRHPAEEARHASQPR